jgi:hypothetical protein
MAKVHLPDAYMRMWLRLAGLPKLAFVVPPHPSDPEPLIGFHVSLLMGLVEFAPYFCSYTETAADLINNSRGVAGLALPHSLEGSFTTPPVPMALRQTTAPDPTRAVLA